MAEGDLITYQGNTNPLSISRSETVNAQRASSSQVATARQNTNIDNTPAKLIANSIAAATEAFNAIATNSKETIAERGTESANRYSQFLNGRVADSQTGVTDDKGVTRYTIGSLEGVGGEPIEEDYSNLGNLKATGQFVEAEILLTENDDSLTRDEKDKIISNLNKLTKGDIYKLQLGTRDDLYKANNATTRSKLHPQVQESFRAPDITIEDMLDLSESKIKSLNANGEEDAKPFNEILKATEVYMNDTTIVSMRFEEAREYLAKVEDSKEGVTDDFAEYYQALQKANISNLARDRAATKALYTKANKETKAALADMNRDLSVVPNAVVLPIDITNNGLDNLVENLTNESIEGTITAVATSMDNTEFEKAMVSLGYSDSKIADEKRKYAKRYMVKMVAGELSTITSKGIPLDNLSPEIKEILKPDLVNEVNNLVTNGSYDVVNEYMAGNDKTVAPIVKNRMSSLLRSLTTVGTPEEYEASKTELLNIVSNIEEHYLDVSADQRVRLQALNKFSMGEYLVLDKTIKDGLYKQTLTKDSLSSKTSSLWDDKTVEEIIENVPYHDQARIKELAFTEQTLTGTVDAEELYKAANNGKLDNGAYIASSILKGDMKSKAALQYVTDTIATKNGKEAKNLVLYKNNGMVSITEGNALISRFTEETFKKMYVAGEIQLNADDAAAKSKANEGVFDKAIQSLRNLF